MSKEYIIYHIPGKKIGVTCDLYNRVTEQQGYEVGEYEVIETSKDIDYVSKRELELQKEYGYRVDRIPYNELNNNNNFNLKTMKINVTEQTTTFPCPLNKLKGQLMDNLEYCWETDHGDVHLDNDLANWIVKNAVTSMYNDNRCYVYNKAMAKFYKNNCCMVEYEKRRDISPLKTVYIKKFLDLVWVGNRRNRGSQRK